MHQAGDYVPYHLRFFFFFKYFNNHSFHRELYLYGTKLLSIKGSWHSYFNISWTITCLGKWENDWCECKYLCRSNKQVQILFWKKVGSNTMKTAGHLIVAGFFFLSATCSVSIENYSQRNFRSWDSHFWRYKKFRICFLLFFIMIVHRQHTKSGFY